MLAEVDALHAAGSLVRIPDNQDVPITDRVRRLIDTPPLRRLASISQLGMVSLVYPGATHSRFEHSLGVYHNAVRLLARFSGDDSFRAMVGCPLADAFLFAALVHDVGHWPFCHPIEDMQLSGLGRHEDRIARRLEEPELARCLQRDWACDPQSVVSLLVPATRGPGGVVADAGPGGSDISGGNDLAGVRFLASCLSGPIDVDKLDYLQRDSLHAGVPYGRNFDAGRLTGAMCVHPAAARLAVGEKGRTAAEMMVFARYVMFSEVYWHHAVRAATAMLQRAVFALVDRVDLEATLELTDTRWIAMLRQAAAGSDAEPLVEGLFGPTRALFKRLAEYNVIDGAETHRRLARRPYRWLVACAERLAERLSQRCGLRVGPADVLIDAPPVKLEVDINIDVVGRDGGVRPLGQVSPVASVLASRQFDDQVKRVRVFIRPDLRDRVRDRVGGQPGLTETLAMATHSTEQELN